jgi:photosystem II stability/assembly factor-like uncharacterized protein
VHIGLIYYLVINSAILVTVFVPLQSHRMKKWMPMLLSALLALPGMLLAQPLELSLFDALKPRNIGPAGMSGRITAIDVDLSDPDIIYAGAASGGVWKSMNGGITWAPIFDEQPVQAIGAVAVNQQNPDVIWVGTGEGNPRNSHNSGAGIYKSLDGGKTWQCMGLQATRNIHRIIVHRDNPQIVYVAALGSIWGLNAERGVFRTKDGGKTWEKVLYVNEGVGCAELVVDPTNPDKLIAAMWEYGRKPWTFNSGGPGSGMYVTLDGGDNWTRRSSEDGLPEGNLGRMGLAIARSKPEVVYALIEAKENALYKSTDGGRKWAKVGTENIGDRPFYYSEIYVDPKNENRVYSLYSLVSRSEDGGKSFSVILPYSGVHPDHHAFWIHPDDPDYLIEGNDGGLNISRDGAKSWRFIPNLPLAQFYHISHDMDIPYNVAGGMQDNGSWVGPSQVWKDGGITNHDWQEVYFGDGFDVVFKPDDNRYVYAMSQGGNLGLVDRETGRTRFIKPVHPEGVELRFNWNAALALDPFNSCGLYYGSQFVHYSSDCGQHWTILSPDLTTNDTSKQQQHKSGGLTIDQTAAENHTTILAIAPSPLDSNVIWVGTDDGRLQLTRDRGRSWTDLFAQLTDAPAGSWIPYIELSATNPGEAFVVVNNYRRNDWRPMVYHTTNYGRKWQRIVDEKQVQGHALTIVQDPVEPKLLWLGTDHGLYFSLNGGQQWQQWNKGYPAVTTIDLKIHPREHDLIIGTFGRAAWILDDIRPLREIAATDKSVLDKSLRLFPAPDAWLANTRSYQGIRFAADGDYEGTNRPYGALLTAWLKDAPEKGQKANMVVLNAAGDTVRTMQWELAKGMNRFSWNLKADGIRFPSRRENTSGRVPQGLDVLPGTYKVVLQIGTHKDSSMLVVHADPRLSFSPQQYAVRDTLYAQLRTLTKAATEGFGRLVNARKTTELVERALVHAPDSTLRQLKKLGGTVRDSLDALEALYMMPEGLKGIQRSADNLNTTLFSASRYIAEVEGDASQMALLELARAKEQVAKVLQAVNNFLTTTFADYRKQVEAVPLQLFKNVEAVDIPK